MTNELVDLTHILYHSSKLAVGITFGWWDGTEIFDKPHDEPDQALDDEYSDYILADDEADNYKYDDESQYDYNTKLFITGVNNYTPLQEEEENMDSNIKELEEE